MSVTVPTCIVVANAARARFLILPTADPSEVESRPVLVEVNDFINPEADELGRDIWSETKSGVGRSPADRQAHSYDDHRDGHLAEMQRRFSKRVMDAAELLVQSNKATRLVVAAPPGMLGTLRPALTSALSQSVAVQEVAKDLTQLGLFALQQHLAREKILPPPR